MPKRKLTQASFPASPLAAASGHPWPQEQCVECYWWLEGRQMCLNRWNALAQPEGECPTRYVNVALLAHARALEKKEGEENA
jgi:hypothetical protein